MQQALSASLIDIDALSNEDLVTLLAPESRAACMRAAFSGASFNVCSIHESHGSLANSSHLRDEVARFHCVSFSNMSDDALAMLFEACARVVGVEHDSDEHLELTNELITPILNARLLQAPTPSVADDSDLTAKLVTNVDGEVMLRLNSEQQDGAMRSALGGTFYSVCGLMSKCKGHDDLRDACHEAHCVDFDLMTAEQVTALFAATARLLRLDPNSELHATLENELLLPKLVAAPKVTLERVAPTANPGKTLIFIAVALFALTIALTVAVHKHEPNRSDQTNVSDKK